MVLSSSAIFFWSSGVPFEGAGMTMPARRMFILRCCSRRQRRAFELLGLVGEADRQQRAGGTCPRVEPVGVVGDEVGVHPGDAGGVVGVVRRVPSRRGRGIRRGRLLGGAGGRCSRPGRRVGGGGGRRCCSWRGKARRSRRRKAEAVSFHPSCWNTLASPGDGAETSCQLAGVNRVGTDTGRISPCAARDSASFGPSPGAALRVPGSFLSAASSAKSMFVVRHGGRQEHVVPRVHVDAVLHHARAPVIAQPHVGVVVEQDLRHLHGSALAQREAVLRCRLVEPGAQAFAHAR